ncbi:MAG: hypothetical protein WDN26_13030 [Chitinophagaceae bacterium]
MKGKYVTLQVLLASHQRPGQNNKDIYAQLEETLAERKRIMERLENISRKARVIDAYISKPKAA